MCAIVIGAPAPASAPSISATGRSAPSRLVTQNTAIALSANWTTPVVRVQRAARSARAETRSPMTNMSTASATSVTGRSAMSDGSSINCMNGTGPDGPSRAPTMRKATSSGRWWRASKRLAR